MSNYIRMHCDVCKEPQLARLRDDGRYVCMTCHWQETHALSDEAIAQFKRSRLRVVLKVLEEKIPQEDA